jgi:Protein of unknown function (DUF1186)/SEC-C motif
VARIRRTTVGAAVVIKRARFGTGLLGLIGLASHPTMPPGRLSPSVQINSMTIPEILKALDTYTGRFPMQAMRAAIEQREAITSELLRVVETVAENSEHYSRREVHMVHVFALYLLAQFREKRAYPFVIKMFSAPGETPFELAGDTVTEGLNRIFASVYDGNPSPLQELFENEAANEYVRNAAIDAFVVLAHTGQMAREAVVAYFTSLFHGRLKRTYSHAWDGLVVAVADLPAPELLEDVRRAYADDLVDPGFAHLEGIERILREQERGRRERCRVITDAIAEMEWWESFKKAGRTSSKAAQSRQSAAVAGDAPSQPKVHKKPWRNAPCPCGSGKKYKHCCGSAATKSPNH